jgi:hypothetical protein
MSMTQLLSDYIFKQSITPFGHKLFIRNETSQMLFTKSEFILIKELKDDGLTLEIPINVCQKGHGLTLFFLSKETDKKMTLPNSGSFKEALFEVIAKVDKVESNSLSKEMVFVDLRFSQYDQDKWKTILKLYSKNQDAINDLLMKQHRGSEE